MKKEQVFSDSHRVGRFFDMNNYRAQAFRFCNSITDGLDSAFTLPEEFFFLEGTEKKRAKNPNWSWDKTDVYDGRHTGVMHDEDGKRVPQTKSAEVTKLYCVRNSKGKRRYKFDVQVIKVFPGLWVSNNPNDGHNYSNTDSKVKSVEEVLKKDKEFKTFSLQSDTISIPLAEFHPFKLTNEYWWRRGVFIGAVKENEGFDPSSEFLNMIFGNLNDAMTFIGRVAESYESNDFSKYTK